MFDFLRKIIDHTTIQVYNLMEDMDYDKDSAVQNMDKRIVFKIWLIILFITCLLIICSILLTSNVVECVGRRISPEE